MERFYLGSPDPSWLARRDYPLCVARQRLWKDKGRGWKTRAVVRWMLDSGAYKMVEANGEPDQREPGPVDLGPAHRAAASVGRGGPRDLYFGMHLPEQLAS